MTVSSAPSRQRGVGLLRLGVSPLELIWTTAALILIAAVFAVAAIVWAALWVEGQLSGTPWDRSVWQMPGVLVDLARGNTTALQSTVARPWRPLTAGAILTTGVAGAVVWGWGRWSDWRSGWRHRQRARDRVRSHTWARRRQLRPLLTARPHGTEPPAHGRLWVGSLDGHDVLVPARTSVMVVAPTRTGKSTRLVVPNLLRWDGPALTTSVKRDVYDLTADRRRIIGPVALFDPTGSTGLPSVRWSPLLTSTTFPDATKTATWLTDAAAVEDKHENAKFWETLATKLLAPMLYAAANTRRTMHDVSHWVDRSAFEQVAGVLTQLGDQDAQAAWQAIRDLPNETRGSVFGTAMAIFRAFGSPRVRQATSCTPGDTDNTLNIARMLRDNGTLYLVSPEYEQAELRPVFVALVQAVYRAAVETSANLLGGAPLNPPLLLMLDEAGNIAPLHTLPKIASTGAGQGITLMTVWQDRAQIRELYGESERTVISNHSTSLWLPGSQDLDTLKLLADLVGEQWVASTNVSANPDGGVSVSEGSERIDVAPPSFLRTLPHGRAVMLSGNRPPALITTHAYFEQPRWRRLVGEQIVRRHAAMHDGTGPTTAQQWDEQQLTDELPSGPVTPPDPLPGPPGPSVGEAPAGSRLAQTLGADYPPKRCDRTARSQWGPLGTAIPRQLSRQPSGWRKVDLPPELAAQLGLDGPVDLADPSVRRRVLPTWLSCGPADALAAAVTWEQLQDQWPLLPLQEIVREAWEDCFPDLGDDIGPAPDTPF